VVQDYWAAAAAALFVQESFESILLQELSYDDTSPESSNASLLHFNLEFELSFSLRELRYMTITTVDSNVDHYYFVQYCTVLEIMPLDNSSLQHIAC
jgi:hypothetical protein